MTLRLAFMGTPEFATPALAELIGEAHDIACVYTRAPRPKGRGTMIHGQSFAMSPLGRGHEMLSHADNIGMTLAVLAGATCDRTILVGAFWTGSDEGALWTRPAVAAIVAATARKAIVTDFCVLLAVVMVLPVRLG